MALQITQGTGTTVGTEIISSTHYQQIKLLDGTAGSTAAIPGDSTNGLFVNVKAIAAGTNYIGKTRITDGTNDITLRSLTSSKALDVSIVDGSGNQITSFGGGTQYAEAATAATATGTLSMAKNGTALKALLVDSSSNLLVSVNTAIPAGSNVIGGVTQSGTWNVTNISGTISLPTGAATAAKQPALGTAGSASTDVITVQGIASMTALKVDGSAVTQPISGTITANIGTSGSLALDATLTGGTQKSIVRGGSKGTSSAADVTSTASGANHQPLDVVIYDTSGNAITSFGGTGGTSSSVGSAVPSTATAAGYSDGTNLQLVRAYDTDSGAGTQYTLGVVLRKSGNGGSTEIDPTQIRTLTSSDQITIANSSIPVTQSGTWNITNISGTVSLPTGASTDASVTGLQVSQGSTTSGQKGSLIQGAVTTSAPTYTTAQTNPLSLQTDGSLRTAVTNTVTVGSHNVTNAGTFAVQAAQSGTWTVATNADGTTGSAVPSKGLLIQGSDGTNARNILTTSSGVIKVDISATAGNSTAVKVDGSSVTQPVSTPKSTTPSLTTVASSATSVSLLSSNSSRLGATIFNDSTAFLYVKLGTTASTTSFTIKMSPNDYYEIPFNYSGAIDGIWSSAAGNARITELT